VTTVFFDVDTQNDFVLPAGALYVPGAERIISVAGRLNQFAADRGHRLISTVDAHTENDPEFRTWRPHCVLGTYGQQKLSNTMVATGQTIFPKVTMNAFASGEMDVLLDAIGAERYFVYGVVAEICVDAVVRGLVRRRGGAGIYVVTDAVRHLDAAAADRFFGEVTASGGQLITALQVISQ
jgi:nicotinamidase/pyrazinamidase